MQKEVVVAVADPHHPAPRPDPHPQGLQAHPEVHAAAHPEDHRQAVDL